ncbi:MAG: hypothetical protein A2046_16900 [Bacteroidetes bacterium GWA2_30_7]|nr:MAG: hypothetical protein A2046_16900 [Bacteroidetes bacterium GWA2_30_7]
MRFLLIIIFLGLRALTFAQNIDSVDFSNPDVYKLTSESPKIVDDQKKILTKANELYKEKKYAEAVVWYRKALKLNPSESFARFRIEDVYTLFINNKIVGSKDEAIALISEVELSQNEAEFDKILNQQVFEARQLIEKPKVDEVALFIEKNRIESEKNATIKTEPVEEVKTETTQAVPIKTEEVKPISKEIIAEKTEPIEEVKIEPIVESKITEKPVENATAEVQTEEKPENKTTTSKPEEKPKIKESKVDSPNAKEVIKELSAKYPKYRTEEVIEDSNKKKYKVIYNDNGNFTIYTKVIHNWGGIFYFVEKPPLPSQNISEEYYLSHIKEQ